MTELQGIGQTITPGEFGENCSSLQEAGKELVNPLILNNSNKVAILVKKTYTNLKFEIRDTRVVKTNTILLLKFAAQVHPTHGQWAVFLLLISSSCGHIT